MMITKVGLYRLLKPIGVMPMGIFVVFIKHTTSNGFKTEGAMPYNHNYYKDEPVELIKEFKDEL